MVLPAGVTLTVVTVVRNDPAGLAATLTSIAEQDCAPAQVVVLDGSDDRTTAPAVLAQFGGLTVDYAWSPPRGVYAAMNTALAMATGTYVYFLNAGDRFAGPTVVATMTTALVQHEPAWATGEVAFLAVDGSRLPEPAWSYERERARLFARGRFPPIRASSCGPTASGPRAGSTPRTPWPRTTCPSCGSPPRGRRWTSAARWPCSRSAGCRASAGARPSASSTGPAGRSSLLPVPGPHWNGRTPPAPGPPPRPTGASGHPAGPSAASRRGSGRARVDSMAG